MQKTGTSKSVVRAKKIILAEKSQELDKISKENSTTSITGLNYRMWLALREYYLHTI